jgi:predicted dehydrogenase
MNSRRNFIKKAAAAAMATGTAGTLLAGTSKKSVELGRSYPATSPGANDQVNIGLIGMGIMGFENLRWSVRVPGVKLVGVCDLYTGRLDRVKELYGKEVFTTKNYQELLDRKDIDAVIISTSDHWHDRMSIEAMNKGKHVYCEKPMVHKLDEGAAVIEAQKKTGKVFQVGSQRVSSIVTEKAQELYEQKLIGDLVLVETYNDRHSPNGAWQYSIPTDASTSTVDWDRFIGDAPKIAYDPVRFFRWRNYQDYGTGVAGDLYVHLFSALHAVTSSSGPSRAYSTGGLRYFKDGRDVPDVLLTSYDYPANSHHAAFNLQMRVNFVAGGGGGEDVRLIGTDGAILLGWSGVKVIRNRMSSVPGFGGWDSFDTFSEAQQKEYEKWYTSKYPAARPQVVEPEIEYKAPEGYSANLDHHTNFYRAIREGKPVREDALFGMQACAASLLANKSYFEKKVVSWDPIALKLV